MTQLSSEEITHLATLARLSLSNEEKERFSQELPKIVEFVEELRLAKVDSDVVSVQPVPLETLREDEVSSERLSLDQLGKLAPNWQEGQVVVPAVFGEAEDV